MNKDQRHIMGMTPVAVADLKGDEWVPIVSPSGTPKNQRVPLAALVGGGGGGSSASSPLIQQLLTSDAFFDTNSFYVDYWIGEATETICLSPDVKWVYDSTVATSGYFQIDKPGVFEMEITAETNYTDYYGDIAKLPYMLSTVMGLSALSAAETFVAICGTHMMAAGEVENIHRLYSNWPGAMGDTLAGTRDRWTDKFIVKATPSTLNGPTQLKPYFHGFGSTDDPNSYSGNGPFANRISVELVVKVTRLGDTL